MVSSDLIQSMTEKGIRLSATAGEAHWQLGIVERTIQTIFQTAEKVKSELKCSVERAVTLAVAAHNTTERVHGFTPSQWAFGRNPTWSETLHDEPVSQINISRDGSDAFQEKLTQMATARKVFEEEILRRKIQLASVPSTERTLFLFLAILFSFGDLESVNSVAPPKLERIKVHG